MQTQTSHGALWADACSRVRNDERYAPLLPWMDRLAASAGGGEIAVFFPAIGLDDLFSPSLRSLLTHLLREVAGEEIEIAFRTNGATTDSDTLDPAHTFGRFVRGSSNRLAAAAAEAVAQEPGTAYNPLLLYGGIGLGKTHLLQALAARLQEERPHWRTRFLPCDTFLSLLRDAPPNGAPSAFLACDVLIVDDIHRIAGDDTLQERLLVLFNQMLQSGSQMAFASLLRPAAMEGISESLTSRLQWGLAVEIEPLSEDLRYRILQARSADSAHPLPDDVLRHVAAQPVTNARDLEGLLHHLESHARLLGQSADLETARDICRAHLRAQPVPAITLDGIERFVCEHFGLRPKDLRSRSRTRAIAYPRQVAMYLAHTLTAASLEDIGRHFGGRDHSTVKHGCDKIRRLSESDTALRDLPDLLRRHAAAPCG